MKKHCFNAAMCTIFVLVGACGGPAKGKLEEPPSTVERELPIIPQPASTAVFGKKLVVKGDLLIVARTTEEKELVNLVGEIFGDLGIQTDIAGTNPEGQMQVLLKIGYNAEILGEEGYILEVNQDGIKVEASCARGLFYGVQSLSQLLPLKRGEPIAIPYVKIIDHPVMKWRGLHLDVARHFFPVEFVKKYIDQMAKYKLNVLHLHLTDDQGWRLEIKKYPNLTEIGSKRRETVKEKNFDPYIGDGITHSGYYSQRDIRELITYAARRHITIVPEIEMPGHAMAALAAYPEYSCLKIPLEVETSWGVKKDVFCTGEKTIEFLTDILDEVVEMFPSEYIHVGGDEVPKDRWKQCPTCREQMRKHGLQNEEQLQNYFMEQIEKHLVSKGKKMIGWDEILEGGKLTETATVMSWRGEAGGIQAANSGHDVVMTPGYSMYFDHYQGPADQEPLAICCYTPLEKVYDYSPVSKGIEQSKRKHVIGVQANVWTEYIATEDHLEYMVFPRALALSELAWTPPHIKNWDSFQSRLSQHFKRLEKDQVNYRLPEPSGLEINRIVSESTHVVKLNSIVEDGEIRYTVDGTIPNKNSHLYEAPLELDFKSTPKYEIKAIAISPSGKVSVASGATFAWIPGGEQEKIDYLSGVRLRIIDGVFTDLDTLSKAEEFHNEVVPSNFDVPRIIGWYSQYGLIYEGFIELEQDGSYSFDMQVAGGKARLQVGKQVLKKNGKLEIILKKGLVPIQLLFFNDEPNIEINLKYALETSEPQPIPLEKLWHAE